MLDQISVIARGQRQIIHQLENLSGLLHESYRKAPRIRTNRENVKLAAEKMKVPLLLSLAVSGLGIFMLKGLLSRD